ncbi:hypothetical protein BH18ACT5_BH18ACT5_09780 [soil metagenome]
MVPVGADVVEADGIETDEVVVPSELGLHATTARTTASAKPERIFTLPGYPGARFGDIERSYDWVVPTIRRPIWVRPSLHTESEADVDRRVSWLELFFDLFFVVAIAQVSHGLADHPNAVGFIDFITRIVLGSNAVLAVAIGFLVWWLYYDFVGRRSPRRNARSSIFWGYLHLPLVIAIVSLGAGMRNILAEASLERSTSLLVTFGVSGVLHSIGLLELTLHRDDDEPTDRESPLLKLLVGVLVLGSVWVTITGPNSTASDVRSLGSTGAGRGLGLVLRTRSGWWSGASLTSGGLDQALSWKEPTSLRICSARESAAPKSASATAASSSSSPRLRLVTSAGAIAWKTRSRM